LFKSILGSLTISPFQFFNPALYLLLQNFGERILMRIKQKSLIVLVALFSLGVRPAYAGGEKQFADGMTAYQSRNYRAASAKFLESLESGNGSPEVYLYMAHSYAACGERNKALKKYHETVKIFKGMDAENMALRCIKRLDPHNQYRDRDQMTTTGNTKKLSLINRIFVLQPTIQGHQHVSPDTVGTVRSVVSQLPKYLYDLLDKNNVNIYIGPNFSDKWPDTLTGSKPGMEELTMSQECARTYDTEIYLFERPTKVGSRELGPPISQVNQKKEITYQLCHAIDYCLNIANDPRLRAEYDTDKRYLSEEIKPQLKYYLQPNYNGVGEVVGSALLNILGGYDKDNVKNSFPRTWKWVAKRMDEERTKRPDLRPANPEKTLTLAKTASAISKAPATTTTTTTTAATTTGTTSSAIAVDDDVTKPEDPAAPGDVLPEEDHVHFYKDPHGKPMVDGFINGRPVRMLIDTGAYRVVVGKKVLDALNIKTPKEKPTRFSHGAGGRFYHWTIPLEITVGKTKRVLKVHAVENESFVCLGQPFLRGLHYRFDNSKSNIFISKNAARTENLMAKDAVEIPFRMVNGNMIIIVKVEGKNLETNFDTGAHGFLIGYKQAKEQGIFDDKEFGAVQLRGIGGKVQDSYACIVKSIELGPMKWSNKPVLLYGGYSVIGQDFFGDRHFVIDNEKKVIRFSRR